MNRRALIAAALASALPARAAPPAGPDTEAILGMTDFFKKLLAAAQSLGAANDRARLRAFLAAFRGPLSDLLGAKEQLRKRLAGSACAPADATSNTGRAQVQQVEAAHTALAERARPLAGAITVPGLQAQATALANDLQYLSLGKTDWVMTVGEFCRRGPERRTEGLKAAAKAVADVKACQKALDKLLAALD